MKKIQDQTKELEAFISSKTGNKQNAYAITTSIAAELGELCDELIALEGDRIEDTTYNNTEKIGKEVVDVIYNTIRIANYYNINMEEHWKKRLSGIKRKFEDQYSN